MAKLNDTGVSQLANKNWAFHANSKEKREN